MIRVGIVGFGFMGGVHFKGWQANASAEVVAICDANPIEGKAKQGNIDTGRDELDLNGVSIYTDIAHMLATENLDAVSITLPTHLHKRISIQCLEAGVHVLCEKPMALSVPDCDAMIAAADAAGKQLMIGHCIRFWPEYQWAEQIISSGAYGSVVAAAFSRLTYAPAWDADSWLSDQNKSGGIALDLHIHDLDFIQFVFGVPGSIRSSCATLESKITGHIQTELEFGADQTISATASWAMPESFGFQMSFRIILEKAVLLLDSQAATPLRLIPHVGDPLIPVLPDGDGYQNEINYFSQLITGSEIPRIITPEEARESVRMALETINS
ncbi:Gfo/Idh/MocA family oxidoreductase [Pontiellaceae bacterium B12227]|nr:Gfo/Idh/MocA family oxidoreductase [Pontiellaceae bacterium B12227]